LNENTLGSALTKCSWRSPSPMRNHFSKPMTGHRIFDRNPDGKSESGSAKQTTPTSAVASSAS
jgi:hypothetical protein